LYADNHFGEVDAEPLAIGIEVNETHYALYWVTLSFAKIKV